jgi:glycosyltransferase involved in cell wall biosynthesis
MSDILISVIVPTYNRATRLAATLDCLACSAYEFDQFEVIVVDDGSHDNTSSIQSNNYPFSFRYLAQPNQGDALARNHGAQKSRGDLLVFLDDDISVTSDLLENLAKAHGGQERLIVAGTLILIDPGQPLQLVDLKNPNNREQAVSIDFTECHSGIQAILRQDFTRLGMLKPLEIGGWSIWCDVEFTYRAYLDGFSFIRCPDVVGYHHDYAQLNHKVYSERMQRVACAGVLLFQRHPEIIEHLPMFRDKTEVVWRKDTPGIIGRKLVRPLSSSHSALKILEKAYASLAPLGLPAEYLEVIQRWIIGGYIYRGFREGLRKYGSVPRTG